MWSTMNWWIVFVLCLVTSYSEVTAYSKRGNNNAVDSSATATTTTNQQQQQQDRRNLVRHYHVVTTDELGVADPDAAIGNPLKGLMPSPHFRPFPYDTGIPHALEFYYIGWKEVMKGNPNIVGEAAAFNWTEVENLITASASRKAHAIIRFYISYPGRPLEVPQYLIDAGAQMMNYTEESDVIQQSPYYADPLLLEAMQQFVRAFGKQYDGDKRIAFIQAGLLGFWGEWHTWGRDFLPDHVNDLAVTWFASSFTKTHVQIRYPRMSAYAAGLGFHDDSFTYETLDGEANGGYERSWYFWPRLVRDRMDDFWRTSVMGGETRIVNQHEMFKPDYQTRTYLRQDFLECVNVTHATYMLHQTAFEDGLYVGEELVNARRGHARMGYNFYVPEVKVRNSTIDGQVDVDVTLMQIGAAPFYYDLSLALKCNGIDKKILSGAETVIDKGASKSFVFQGLPTSPTCLQAITLTLESSYAYAGRPIKFAQGNGSVVFSLPLPYNYTQAPSLAPTRFPTSAPTTRQPTKAPASKRPTRAPVRPPTKAPKRLPTTKPTKAPTTKPTKAPTPRKPTRAPTKAPTLRPTRRPTQAPTLRPTFRPTLKPTRSPTLRPTFKPTRSPTLRPTRAPTRTPTRRPTLQPTRRPTMAPTKRPTRSPTLRPTRAPTNAPTKKPTRSPTKQPTRRPTNGPTRTPTQKPTQKPTRSPTRNPTRSPVLTKPTRGPTLAPTARIIESSVIDFVLINADTDRPLRSLRNATKLSPVALKTSNWNIVAVTSSNSTGSVQFAYDRNLTYRMENQAPFAIGGSDGNGDYYSWVPEEGIHTVTATPYSGRNATGRRGTPRTVTFNVLGWGID